MLKSASGISVLAGARTQRETADLDLVLNRYRAISPNENITRRAYYLMKTYARSHGLRTLDSLIAAAALEEGSRLRPRIAARSVGASEIYRSRFHCIHAPNRL
jgi:predicted nucleic acid-binding protein